jgi:hypothetical protein
MQPDEPKATGEYEAALNAIGETDIGHTVKTVIKPRSFSSREQYILKIWKPPLLNSLADVVLPHSLELSKHWTTSNLLCGLMFGVMLTLDTIGIDWQQAEASRITSDVWKIYYEKPGPRKILEQRRELRELTNDWTLLDDETQMKYATAWVRVHHGLEKSLSDYVQQHGVDTSKPEWERGDFRNSTYKNWQRRVKEIDNLIEGRIMPI